MQISLTLLLATLAAAIPVPETTPSDKRTTFTTPGFKISGPGTNVAANSKRQDSQDIQTITNLLKAQHDMAMAIAQNAKRDDAADAQAQTAEMLSSFLKAQHDTEMAIVQNIKDKRQDLDPAQLQEQEQAQADNLANLGNLLTDWNHNAMDIIQSYD